VPARPALVSTAGRGDTGWASMTTPPVTSAA
jgi:hypothetical protein